MSRKVLKPGRATNRAPKSLRTHPILVLALTSIKADGDILRSTGIQIVVLLLRHTPIKMASRRFTGGLLRAQARIGASVEASNAFQSMSSIQDALPRDPQGFLIVPTQTHAGRLLPRHFQRGITASFAAQDSGPPSEEEAIREMAEAFEQLITEAYKLAGEGKVAEAVYLLSEGAKQAEKIMGEGAVEVAPLFDQLALIQFMADQCEDAQAAARKAWDAVRTYAEQDPGPAARGAGAAAAVRYATTLVGCRQHSEALGILIAALDSLQTAIAEQGSSAAVDDPFGEKFEIAAGEGRFYRALCVLATKENLTLEDAEASWPELDAGVAAMTEHLGERHPLTACALRELHRVSEMAVESGNMPLAGALFRHEVLLIRQRIGPDGAEAASMLYQMGTVQYTLGHYAEAVRCLEEALEMFSEDEASAEGEEENLLILKHRLALAQGAAGETDRARQVLGELSPILAAKLGEGNPVSDESDYMLALMDLREEAAKPGGGDAVRKQDLVVRMGAAVERLKALGGDHPLVHRAQELLEEAKQL